MKTQAWKKKKPKKQKQPSPKTNKKTKKGFRMGNRHFPKDINGQQGFLKMFHFCKSWKECQQEPPWILPPERPKEIELKPVVFIVSRWQPSQQHWETVRHCLSWGMWNWLTWDPTNLLLSIYSNVKVHTEACMWIFTVALFMKVRMGISQCLSTSQWINVAYS